MRQINNQTAPEINHPPNHPLNHLVNSMENRQQALAHWLKDRFLLSAIKLHPLRNDASFRQYYRCTINGCSYVVMDAPPDKENILLFIQVTKILEQVDVLVPELVAYDLTKGFIVLSDFGDDLLLDQLNSLATKKNWVEISNWYQIAIDNLIGIQQATPEPYGLPNFDVDHIKLELSYFSEWFLDKLLKVSLTAQQQESLNTAMSWIIQSALDQPQVVIHRDFHSRNLMVLPDRELGIIDYQDAMIGPISYDLVSLLKDCYIVWPKAQVAIWLEYYYKKALKLNRLSNQTGDTVNTVITLEAFTKYFELMGLQRHLKVLGVFSRLNIRDNKPRYLDDIPRIIQYVLEVTQSYPEFSELQSLFVQQIIPAFEQYQAAKEGQVCTQ